MKSTKSIQTTVRGRNTPVEFVVFIAAAPSMRTRWTIKPVGSDGWSVRSF